MPAPFDEAAPRLMADLIRDFSLRDFQAAGFVGNFGEESGLISGRQERSRPTDPPAPILNPDGTYPHNSGIDWPQWTGSRRGDFGKWVARTGAHYPSYEASYGFLKYELSGPYRHAVEQVKKTTTVRAAAETAEAHYEHAGIKNMAARISFAERALALYRAQNKESPVTTSSSTAPPADPPAIPWYKSGVFVGGNAGIIGTLLAMIQAYKPGVPITQQLDVLGPLAFALIGSLVAVIQRWTATAQPLTATQSSADQYAAPEPVAEAWNPLSPSFKLTNLPLSFLISEIPEVLNLLGQISQTTRPAPYVGPSTAGPLGGPPNA